MDTRTGKILDMNDVDVLRAMQNDLQMQQHVKPMRIQPTPKQLRLGKIGRNEPCPCGSGKKFKKCCLVKRS